MVKTKWLAALSDGSTAVEGTAPFDEVKNEPSPWNKLLAHIEKNGLHITGMRVQVSKPGEATRTYNLPSFNRTKTGRHEKWPRLLPLEPAGYSYGRVITGCVFGDEAEQHQIQITAHFPNFSLSLLVDEDDGNECWVVAHE